MTTSTPALPITPERGLLAGMSGLVTGSEPTGVATARALASAGCSVAFAGPDDLALLRAARTIEASGGRAVPLPVDLRDPQAMRRAVASASESFGSLDLAVNTAADCRAVYLAIRSQVPAIVAAGGGAIVNAAAPPLGRHAEEAQCIIGLSRAAALDQVDGGVRVNAVISGDGTPADFAAIAVWLCSARGAHVSGAAVPVELRPRKAVQPTHPGRTRPYS